MRVHTLPVLVYYSKCLIIRWPLLLPALVDYTLTKTADAVMVLISSFFYRIFEYVNVKIFIVYNTVFPDRNSWSTFFQKWSLALWNTILWIFSRIKGYSVFSLTVLNFKNAIQYAMHSCIEEVLHWSSKADVSSLKCNAYNTWPMRSIDYICYSQISIEFRTLLILLLYYFQITQ